MKKFIALILAMSLSFIFGATYSYADAKADDYEDAPAFPMKTPYQRNEGDVSQDPLNSWKRVSKSHPMIQQCLHLGNLALRDECLRNVEAENMQSMEELTYYAMTLCERRYDKPKACADQAMKVYKGLMDAYMIKANSSIAFYDDPDRFIYNAVDSADAVVSFLIFIGGMQQTFPNSYKNN